MNGRIFSQNSRKRGKSQYHHHHYHHHHHIKWLSFSATKPPSTKTYPKALELGHHWLTKSSMELFLKLSANSMDSYLPQTIGTS